MGTGALVKQAPTVTETGEGHPHQGQAGAEAPPPVIPGGCWKEGRKEKARRREKLKL